MDNDAASVIAPNESSVIVELKDKPLSDRIISSRYLFSDKAEGKSTPSKPVPPEPNCRICVRGFEDLDLLDMRRDAPTVGREAVAIIVCVGAAKGHEHWILFPAGVKPAFLEGVGQDT